MDSCALVGWDIRTPRPVCSSLSPLARRTRLPVSESLSSSDGRPRFLAPRLLCSKCKKPSSSSPENTCKGCTMCEAPKPTPTDPIPCPNTQKAAVFFAWAGTLFCAFCFSIRAMFCKYSLLIWANSVFRNAVCSSICRDFEEGLRACPSATSCALGSFSITSGVASAGRLD